MSASSKTKLMFFSTLLCIPAFLLIAYLLPSNFESTQLPFPIEFLAAIFAFIILAEFLYVRPFFEKHPLLSQEGKVSSLAMIGTTASILGFVLFMLSKNWIYLFIFLLAHLVFSASIYLKHLR